MGYPLKGLLNCFFANKGFIYNTRASDGEPFVGLSLIDFVKGHTLVIRNIVEGREVPSVVRKGDV